MNERVRRVGIGLAVAGVVGVIPLGLGGTASAYTPQNCGTQTVTAGSASATVQHHTTFIATCGMKASIRCQKPGQPNTGWIHSSGSPTSAGQSRSVNCAAGWTRLQHGHQEGTNW
jgi:hypothetical protein